MNTFRPYCVLATLNGDTQRRWWIRNPNGSYTEWQPANPNTLKRTVQPQFLKPAVADFQTYIGDVHAIAELHRVRDEVARARA